MKKKLISVMAVVLLMGSAAAMAQTSGPLQAQPPTVTPPLSCCVPTTGRQATPEEAKQIQQRMGQWGQACPGWAVTPPPQTQQAPKKQ